MMHYTYYGHFSWLRLKIMWREGRNICPQINHYDVGNQKFTASKLFLQEANWQIGFCGKTSKVIPVALFHSVVQSTDFRQPYAIAVMIVTHHI